MGHPLCVHNEIGRLRSVMLHRPGDELLNLSPASLESLLFDDIPYLQAAQAEHDAFADILRDEGVRVLYLEDLVAQALDSDPTLRLRFIGDYVRESGVAGTCLTQAVRELLSAIPDTTALVRKVICGIRRDELGIPRRGMAGTGLADLLDVAHSGNPDLVIDPMPNLYFTRDSFTVVGHGVNLNHMSRTTRRRETLLGQYVFAYHPDYHAVPLWYRRDDPHQLEGGDFVNLSADTVAIGVSQRTSPAAIDLFAKGAFWGGEDGSEVRRIYAFRIPATRAMMHLDTVFTQLDAESFLYHPGILDTLEVFRITPGARHGEISVTKLDDDMPSVMAEAMGMDSVRMIPCGGGDPIAASREQWNDGANTLAVSPGRVLVYQRNSVTNDILYKAGYELLEIPSAELSRGRGGPHCMSMPFVRDDL